MHHILKPQCTTTDANAQNSLYRVFLPVAIGQILASAEALSLKNEYQESGILRGVCAQQFPQGTVRCRLASSLDSPFTPKILACVNLAASAGLIVARQNRNLQIASSTVLAVTNRLNELRTPYGRDGADQMTSVITQYRSITSLIPENKSSDDIFLRAVNFQAGLSYAVSGISKAFGSSWIQGDSLGEILQTEAYGRGPAARILKKFPHLSRILTVGTVLWELAFPIIYLIPRKQARLGLGAVKLFHLAVAATMELPRFVWGFFSSHGAIEYTLDQPQKKGGLEKATIGLAAALTLGSAVIAHDNRKAVKSRRLGPKGGTIMDSAFGKIEYQLHRPESESVSSRDLTLVLESGLGEPMESWEWIARELSQDFTVLRYHRAGYEETKASGTNAEILETILTHAGIEGELIPVTHSIGSLIAATYVREPNFAHRIKRMIIIDGTDPSHLQADRTHRKTLGKFLQAQLHTLFASVTGIYNWAPNATQRQAGYTPNIQFSYLHSVFSPQNILNAVHEYLHVPTKDAIENLSQVESVFVIGSAEFTHQQKTLAHQIDALHETIPDSRHKSILGKRKFAVSTAATLKRFIHAN